MRNLGASQSVLFTTISVSAPVGWSQRIPKASRKKKERIEFSIRSAKLLPEMNRALRAGYR
jgi:hypothetical protein